MSFTDGGSFFLPDAEATARLGGKLAEVLKAGDMVLLWGELGAGKTTFVRGLLRALGVDEAVRSPTFNLIQTFPTQPPVMHADLYRVSSSVGLGLEDYLESHACLVEWPDRLEPSMRRGPHWDVRLDFMDGGRQASVAPPVVG